MRVIFYHGLEGTPQGDKPTALRKTFPQLEAPDFQDVDPVERLRRASADIVARNEPVFLIGSSLGGVTAAIMADRHPDLVKGYLLCAPAMHFNFNYPTTNHTYGTMLWTRHGITHVPKVSLILLGSQDTIHLNAEALAFAEFFKIRVAEVQDGHRLADNVDVIVALAKGGYDAATFETATQA